MPFGDAEYYRARPAHCDRSPVRDRPRRARSTSTASSASTRASLRSASCGIDASSPSSRRAARPTTRDRTSTRRTTWKRRRRASRARKTAGSIVTLQARKTERESSFRAVALTQQLPRMLQGHAPALAMNQVAQFGIQGGGNDAVSSGFEAQYAAAADHVLNGVGREAFDAMKTLEGCRSGALPARERCRVSAQRLWPGADADCPAYESRSRARSRVRRSRRLGHARESGIGTGPTRDAAGRLLPRPLPRSSPISATAWPTLSS